MKRICQHCGKEYEGAPGSISCPDCVALHKKNPLRPRTCRTCGTVFMGGPRAWFCPECRAERRKAAHAEYLQRKKLGKVRKIGSTDLCTICGKEYTVESGLQRYCPKCAEDQGTSYKREHSLKYYKEKVDKEERKRKRNAAAAPIPCIICGKMFVPRDRAQTCSPECSRKLANQLSREWGQEHKDIVKKKKGILLQRPEASQRREA